MSASVPSAGTGGGPPCFSPQAVEPECSIGAAGPSIFKVSQG